MAWIEFAQAVSNSNPTTCLWTRATSSWRPLSGAQFRLL